MSETAALEAIAGIGGGIAPKREEIVSLLSLSTASARILWEAADEVRRRGVGDGILLRGIIEFSNYCLKDCLYCGLRRSNRRLPRYRMKAEEVVAAAVRIREEGVGTVVLQSGEDPFYDPERLAALVEAVRRETGLTVTLSVGERGAPEYRRWQEAGARRFLLKFETSDPRLYERLRPGCRLRDRLACLNELAEAGYEVGTGNIVGLPGQNLETLADDLLLLRRIRPQMVGIGPFLPHPDTPLAGEAAGDMNLTLKTLAVTRLLLPEANIPSTTALAALSPSGRMLGLKAGANVVMPDFTPLSYRRLYEIYPGRNRAREAGELIGEMREMVEREGRFLAEEDATPSLRRAPGEKKGVTA